MSEHCVYCGVNLDLHHLVKPGACPAASPPDAKAGAGVGKLEEGSDALRSLRELSGAAVKSENLKWLLDAANQVISELGKQEHLDSDTFRWLCNAVGQVERDLAAFAPVAGPTQVCSKCGDKTWSTDIGLCEKCSPNTNSQV